MTPEQFANIEWSRARSREMVVDLVRRYPGSDLNKLNDIYREERQPPSHVSIDLHVVHALEVGAIRVEHSNPELYPRTFWPIDRAHTHIVDDS